MRPWRFVALFALLILTACGDSTGPAESIFGTYTLRTVNGVALPYVYFQNGADSQEVSAATLSLEEGGTYGQTVDFRDSIGGTVTTSRATVSGTFTYGGTTVTFRTQSGKLTAAVLSGGTLTIGSPADGGAQVYVK